MEGKHVSSTSPAADPLGKVLHHGFEGNRVLGEDHISTAEEELEETHLLGEVSDQRALLEILLSLGVDQDVAAIKVSELYSPPRITKAAHVRPDLGTKGLKAFDLSSPHPGGGHWEIS